MSMTDEERGYLVRLELAKAHETFEEIEILRNAFKWNGAANRVYYLAFHAVNALFINDEIQSARHKASHALFSLHYIKTGKLPADYGRLYNNLQTLREKSDYNCFYQVTEQDIADSVEQVKHFIDDIEKLINVNN